MFDGTTEYQSELQKFSACPSVEGKQAGSAIRVTETTKIQ